MAADRQKLIQNAERLVGRGKLNAAIEEYLKVVESHPDDTNTLNRVGDLYARLQRMGEAIELFKQAAEHHTEEGFFVKAIAIYKKILRFDPSQLEASESLAGLQARQGLITDSRQQYLSVAEGYKRRGDTASVIAVHRKLVELEPDDPTHRLHLAELLESQEQILDAMDQYGAIAKLFLGHDKVEEAVRVCRQAFELDHSNLNFVSSAVGELQRKGYAEEAEEFLEFALEKNPDVQKIQVEKEEEEPEEEIEEAEPEEEDETLAEVEAAPEPEIKKAKPALKAEPEVYELEIEDDEEEEFEIELEELEAVAAEPEVEKPPEEPEEEIVAEEAETEPEVEVETEVEGLKELLIEAEVLARYGLEDKAIEKFEEIVDLAPQHVDAHLDLIDLHLEHQNVGRVAELAELVFELAKDQGRTRDWKKLKKELTSNGFEIAAGKVSPPEVQPEAAEVEADAGEGVDAPAEGLSWLDEVTTRETVDESDAEGVFESEAEFFDLASELEKELEEEDGMLEEELVTAPEEQSLEEIVEGFKKGMAETLAPEDYDTHYNLGIAYREMDLIDEAISEFQLAAKDNRYLVDCCSLLAACFIEKGFPELAIKWYNEGLSSPIITEEETLGLVYELGDLYLSIGETAEARLRFVEIYGVNSDYRDIGSKLAGLDQA